MIYTNHTLKDLLVTLELMADIPGKLIVTDGVEGEALVVEYPRGRNQFLTLLVKAGKFVSSETREADFKFQVINTCLAS